MKAFLLIISILVSGSCLSQSPHKISVFGTENITSQEIVEIFGDELNELRQLYGSDEYKSKRDQLENKLKAHQNATFVNINLLKDYVGNFKFIIDFVSSEDSQKRLNYRDTPERIFDDPDGLIQMWNKYDELSFDLFYKGEIGNTNCPVFHCTWAYDHPQLKPYYDYFEKYVPLNQEILIEILHNSESANFRSSAAFLLAHANLSAQHLVDILIPAVNDPSTSTRNNSMRVIYYIVKEYDEIKLDLNPIIKALNYPSNSDRNKAIVIFRSLPIERFSPSQIKEILPVLITCLKEKDNNAGSAHKVLKKISGQEYAIEDFASWRVWGKKYN